MTALVALALGASVWCEPAGPYTVTAYSAEMFPGLTADGTTTTVGALARGEHIAAGSWNLPFGTQVRIDGWKYTYTIRDRGYLNARHIDVLVPTTAQALELGRERADVCVMRWSPS